MFYVNAGFHIGGLDTDVYKGTKQGGKPDILFYFRLLKNSRAQQRLFFWPSGQSPSRGHENSVFIAESSSHILEPKNFIALKYVVASGISLAITFFVI